jgi:hypothetical protein
MQGRSGKIKWLGLLLVLSGLAAVLGCGQDEPPPRKHETHIRGIWHAALFYRQYNNYQWPRDAAELKQWAEATLTPHQVKDLGLVSLEETFVSPRDGEPYVVLQVVGSPPTVNPHDGGGSIEEAGPIFAHEAKGIGGKKYVVYASSFAAELSEDEFQQALSRGSKQ